MGAAIDCSTAMGCNAIKAIARYSYQSVWNRFLIAPPVQPRIRFPFLPGRPLNRDPAGFLERACDERHRRPSWFVASTKKAGTHRSRIVESLQDACDLESGSRDQFEHAPKGRLASQLSLVKSMISSSLVSGGKQSASKATL
jgi:hypothetical protein